MLFFQTTSKQKHLQRNFQGVSVLLAWFQSVALIAFEAIKLLFSFPFKSCRTSSIKKIKIHAEIISFSFKMLSSTKRNECMQKLALEETRSMLVSLGNAKYLNIYGYESYEQEDVLATSSMPVRNKDVNLTIIQPLLSAIEYLDKKQAKGLLKELIQSESTEITKDRVKFILSYVLPDESIKGEVKDLFRRYAKKQMKMLFVQDDLFTVSVLDSKKSTKVFFLSRNYMHFLPELLSVKKSEIDTSKPLLEVGENKECLKTLHLLSGEVTTKTLARRFNAVYRLSKLDKYPLNYFLNKLAKNTDDIQTYNQLECMQVLCKYFSKDTEHEFFELLNFADHKGLNHLHGFVGWFLLYHYVPLRRRSDSFIDNMQKCAGALARSIMHIHIHYCCRKGSKDTGMKVEDSMFPLVAFEKVCDFSYLIKDESDQKKFNFEMKSFIRRSLSAYKDRLKTISHRVDEDYYNRLEQLFSRKEYYLKEAS